MIELSLVLMITVMIVTVLILFQSRGWLSYAGLRNRVEMVENLRIATNRINRELHQAVASSVLIDHNGHRIRFQCLDGAEGGFQYDPYGKEIELRTRDGSNWTPLASGINQLTFDQEQQMVIYSVTAAAAGTDPVTMTSEVYLEN